MRDKKNSGSNEKDNLLRQDMINEVYSIRRNPSDSNNR